MKKRLLIKLFYTVFFFLAGMGIMYLYTQKQPEPMVQIQELMSKNKVEADEAIYIYLKNKRKPRFGLFSAKFENNKKKTESIMKLNFDL